MGKTQIYGFDGTIHSTKYLDVEVDPTGHVVAVWFRCCALPFKETRVDYDRGAEMEVLSARVNAEVKLHGISVEQDAPDWVREQGF